MGEAQRNVLVVDDDPNDRALIASILRLRGIDEIDSARDGAEALHRLTTKRYSLVILDIVMPLMSGIDLLDSLVALANGQTGKKLRCPEVIVITSCSEADLSSQEVVLRYDGCVRAVLRKPFSVRSHDSNDQSRKFIAKIEADSKGKVAFRLLSDPKSEVIDRYALRDPAYADYKQRATTAEIRAALEAIR